MERCKVMSVGWRWKTARSGAAKNIFTKASVQRKIRVLPVKVRCLGTNTEMCVSEQGILFWETVVLTGSSTPKQRCDERVNVITVFANTGALSRNLVHVLLLVFKLLQLLAKYSVQFQHQYFKQHVKN